jgi:hypothetical protein
MSETTTQTPGGETFIRERQRGMKIGQRDLYARANVKDDAELISLVEAGRKAVAMSSKTQAPDEQVAEKKKPPVAETSTAKQPDETTKQYEARLNELAEAAKKFQARFDKEDKEREEAKARAEAKAKEDEEAIKARKDYEAEVADFYEVAAEVGAVVTDKRKKVQLLALWNAELEDMSERTFQKLFGDNVPEEKRAENLKAQLKELAKEHPALFKVAEAEKADPKKPATTGTSVTTADNAKPNPGTREPLDVRKLSKSQYGEYSRNPKLFKERYEQGLVEYPKAK